MSLNNIHVLITFIVIDPTFGKGVILVIQLRKEQDVRHVMLDTRVMGMEVVFHVNLMNVVLQTQQCLKQIVLTGIVLATYVIGVRRVFIFLI